MDWILVFLGNPGSRYVNTRHNVGWMVADELTRVWHAPIKLSRFHSLTTTCTVAEQELLLMKPQTYMNRSGEPAAEAAAFYELPPERVIVVSDDAALPLGKLRVRRGGRSGGHNGLRSIISRLGTEKFPRVKIGVGVPEGSDAVMIDWVLGVFTPAELNTMDKSVKLAAEAIHCLITEGVDIAMNKFN